MVSWGELRAAEPELAESGRALFYQFGVGLGMLATVRRDGAPRVNPMCPLVFGEALLAFIVPGPKCDDLARDGRFALHCYAPAENEDAFSLAGRAVEVLDPAVREAAAAQFFAERQWTEAPPGFGAQRLFEFDIERCLLTRTTGHGDHAPRHRIWRAPAS